jgi:hypothetical protein
MVAWFAPDRSGGTNEIAVSDGDLEVDADGSGEPRCQGGGGVFPAAHVVPPSWTADQAGTESPCSQDCQPGSSRRT